MSQIHPERQTLGRDGKKRQRKEVKRIKEKSKNLNINENSKLGWHAPDSTDYKADSLAITNDEGPSSHDLSKFENVHRVDLSFSNLSCGLGFLQAFSATLTWLCFKGCKGLTDFSGLEELETLYVLNLQDCGLTTLPLELATMDQLKALVLSSNSLTELPYMEDKPHLNSLIVSHNMLSSLPDSISSLSSLTKLSCAHNSLTAEGLPDLSNLSELREVRMNGNAELSSLPPHFSTWGTSRLEILDLSKCNFSSWDSLEALEGQEELSNVNMRGNPLCPDAAEATEQYTEYKDLAIALLPKLRILDNQRFDQAFLDRKAKRKATPKGSIAALKATKKSKASEPAPKPDEGKPSEEKSARAKRKRKDASPPLLSVHGKSLSELPVASGSKKVGTTVDGDSEAQGEKPQLKAKKVKKVKAEAVEQQIEPRVEMASEEAKGKKKRKSKSDAKEEPKAKRARKEDKAPLAVGGSLSNEGPAQSKAEAEVAGPEQASGKGEAAGYKIVEVKRKRPKKGADNIDAILKGTGEDVLGAGLNVGGW